MKVVLALDQGSSATKALALDEELQLVASASAPVPCARPRDGWAEFEPAALWRSVEAASAACLARLPVGTEVVAVGVANQRESAMLWDRSSGVALGPCVSWQCRRGAPQCEHVRRLLGGDVVRQITGLALDASYSAAKWAWLLERCPPGTEPVAGTVDSFLASRLTGGRLHVCDMGNASRTQLFDLTTKRWSPTLLEAFSIPAAVLPTVVASAGALGGCEAVRGLESAPLAALCGDSHAALFSHYVGDPRALKATYGTGSSVLSPLADAESPGGPLARSIVWQLDEAQLGLEGNIPAAGAALDWIADLLGMGSFTELEAAAASVSSSEGVAVVPALHGLGVPWNAPRARGLIEGFGARTGRAEIARAGFEAIAHQVADVVECLVAEDPVPHAVLYADGGLGESALLLQLQADLLGLPVVQGSHRDASGIGAACLAGLGIGLWSTSELAARTVPRRRFEPRISDDERAARRARWRESARRAAQASVLSGNRHEGPHKGHEPTKDEQGGKIAHAAT